MDTQDATLVAVPVPAQPTLPEKSLSSVAESLVDAFTHQEKLNEDNKIRVNRFVSELASWYEKLRNAMDYREDEVVLRAAVERILKRRHLFGGEGKTIAGPLLRELVWARYFPDNTLPESMTAQVSEVIDLYLYIKNKVALQKALPESVLSEWTYQLISCHIARLLSPNQEKNIMSNFMFHIMKNGLIIEDDTEDTKNVQMYLAVRRAFAKDDIAFLRYYLFQQLFGEVTRGNIEHIADSFQKGYDEINKQLAYPLKEKIFLYVKRMTPVFFIMEDVFRKERGNVRALLKSPDAFADAVYAACDVRYKGIASKVRRAIIRSVIFLIFTKVVFAFAVEGTYENLLYGHIIWMSILINIGVPPLLMILVGLMIRTPKKDNSERILQKIQIVLHEEQPKIHYTLKLWLHPKKNRSLLGTIFGFLWLGAFLVSFGCIYYVLSRLGFDIISKAVFMFFIAIVSFLSYRINSTAHMYNIGDRQGILTPFVDFLFIPIVRVGMRLTEGVSKINIFIFIFDFLIEAPFKGIFAFFEQWFLYLHTKREDLG